MTARPSSRQGTSGRSSRDCPGRGTSVKDRKSTRLNSSHLVISYAVFCLKKKKKISSYVTLLFVMVALLSVALAVGARGSMLLASVLILYSLSYNTSLVASDAALLTSLAL